MFDLKLHINNPFMKEEDYSIIKTIYNNTWMVSKNKAIEVQIDTKDKSDIFMFTFLVTGRDEDHHGLRVSLGLFYIGWIDINFYDGRHADHEDFKKEDK